MTLINVHLTPKRAIVLTDTLCSRGDQPSGFGSKLTWLPHLHAIVATRGRTMTQADAEMGLNGILPLQRGLESVPDELPEHLRIWTQFRADDLRREGRCLDLSAQVFVVGWSRAERHARAWRFFSDNDFDAEELPEGFHIEPDVSGGKLPRNVTPQQMIEAAKIQKKAMDRQAQSTGDGGPCIGGELWACEITFAGFNLKRVHTFEES